jgi:hypothetical protein
MCATCFANSATTAVEGRIDVGHEMEYFVAYDLNARQLWSSNLVHYMGFEQRSGTGRNKGAAGQKMVGDFEGGARSG